jgi:RNA polymerase sigma factor (sigma-70 family)
LGSRISPETAEAVAQLFREEAVGLFGYARVLLGSCRSYAEDLVQMTFHAAAVEWECRLASLDRETRRRWLYRVLRNKAIDHLRTCGSREVPLEGTGSPIGLPDDDTFLRAMSAVLLQRCWDRIAKMPEARQRVAFLKWGKGWSSDERAEFLKIAQSTVRAHLKLARDELIEEIGPQVVVVDPDDHTGEEGRDGFHSS